MTTPLVLVVDDDDSARQIVSLALRDEGYCVVTAASMPQALAAIDRARPACVLLDLALPGIDGRAMPAAMRARGLDVPIILMTAAHEPRHWATEIGAMALLAKPFDLNDLLDAVAAACRGRIPEPPWWLPARESTARHDVN